MTQIDTIIQQMTLEEKAALCTGAGPWTTTPIERLGVPALTVSDGPHGVRHPKDPSVIGGESHPATCFPTASCQAATWNVELIQEMGKALAEECIALNVDVVLGPGNNIKRSPLGGRNFEYYSEDPYLAGEMAAALIDGVQSQGVGVSLKHFAANNQEFQRFSINAEVDERTLREIYLAAFETPVKKSHPWTVMCAYNRLNGILCSENHRLLVDILRGEWGFDGFVVSDWGAVHDRVDSLKGGLDLEMPGPKPRRTADVVQAVRSGRLDEAVLDQAVRNILNIVYKAAQTPKGRPFDKDANHALARKIASEGIVLLKNNGILPLKNPRRIAVIGHSAQEPHFQGGGSSFIKPTRVSVPLEELQQQAGQANITFAEGYPAGDKLQPELIDQAVTVAQSAEVALLFLALPASKESEGYDRADLELTHQQLALIQAVSKVQPNTIVILNTGSPVAMIPWIDGVAAVIEAWMMGQAGGGAIADVLFGKVNPSGKLAETFALKVTDTPAYLNWPGGNGQVTYGEGLFVGYRYYDMRETPVLFPFGYGLSYTSFSYTNLRVSAATFKDTEGLDVQVDVTNTGSLAGKEVIQVYVGDEKSGLVRPPKELKGFAKVDLQPGETKTVKIHLDFRAFAYFHPGFRQWITEDGDVNILIGASAADIRCTQIVTLQSTLTLPSLLNHESTVREWLESPQGRPLFEPMFQQMTAGMSQTIGGDGSDGIGMDMLGFMMDMPLVSILNFQSSALPVPAEDIVADLLRQVHEQE